MFHVRPQCPRCSITVEIVESAAEENGGSVSQQADPASKIKHVQWHQSGFLIITASMDQPVQELHLLGGLTLTEASSAVRASKVTSIMQNIVG